MEGTAAARCRIDEMAAAPFAEAVRLCVPECSGLKIKQGPTLGECRVRVGCETRCAIAEALTDIGGRSCLNNAIEHPQRFLTWRLEETSVRRRT